MHLCVPQTPSGPMNTAVPVGLKAGDKFFLQMAPQPVAVQGIPIVPQPQGVGPGFSLSIRLDPLF